MTQQAVCEPGAIQRLASILDEHDAQQVFLVTGRRSFAASGAERALTPLLKGRRVTRFHDFEENPRYEDLQRGIQLFREGDFDLVLAVGGGSVMDMAKMINVFAPQQSGVLDHVKGGLALEALGLPLVAVPTTAGSGSQATHFSVLYVDGQKHSVGHPCMLPDVALVDADLLASVTPKGAATTGLDALNQAMESFWSIHATEGSRALAREAIELVRPNLVEAVRHPNPDALAAMALGAHRAGEAIDTTRTTAPHAISYPITSRFGVPHGHAVGLVMAPILLYNAAVQDDDVLDPRGAAHVRETLQELSQLLGARDAAEASQVYDRIMDEIGLSRNLAELGIRSQADLEWIVEHGFNPERVNNNPRRLTEEALRRILQDLAAPPSRP